MMRAIICTADQKLQIQVKEQPIFSLNTQVNFARISIKAFGINRADLLQKAGHYPAPPGVAKDILGLEFAGVIEAFSNGADHCEGFQLGDRVMGICSGEAYAEQIIVPCGHLLPIPAQFSFSTAASIPEAHLTAYDALVNQGQLKEEDEILIHAIGSGVGCAAAKIADFLGAKVSGTTRSLWKKERALSQLHLQKVYLSEHGRFMGADEQNNFDLILDFIGAAYLKENMQRLKHQGRLVMIGLLGGIKAELNLGILLAKRAQIIGTVLRSRSIQEKADLTQAYRQKILPFLIKNTESLQSEDQGIKLEPVYKVYAPHELEQAHQDLANSQVWSKLVCQWD